MTDEELAYLLVGDLRSSSSSGLDVVGACGELNAQVLNKYYYHPLVMADGPAGIRLKDHYYIDKNNKIKVDDVIPKDLMIAKTIYKIVNKFLSKKARKLKQFINIALLFLQKLFKHKLFQQS